MSNPIPKKQNEEATMAAARQPDVFEGLMRFNPFFRQNPELLHRLLQPAQCAGTESDK